MSYESLRSQFPAFINDEEIRFYCKITPADERTADGFEEYFISSNPISVGDDWVESN